MNSPILAWHFAKSDRKTRYSNEDIVEGKTLSAKGPLIIRDNGMHASLSILDALRYAPGPVLSRVELSGETRDGYDKHCSRHRKHLKVADITPQLREFALLCAERVLPIFEKRYPEDDRPRKCLETTRKYLAGKATAEELSAANAAANDAANAAAYAAAYAAYDAAYAAYDAVAATSAAYAASAAASAAAANAAAYAATAAYDAATAYAANAAATTSAAYAYAAAAAAATSAAERKWQEETLLKLINPLFS